MLIIRERQIYEHSMKNLLSYIFLLNYLIHLLVKNCSDNTDNHNDNLLSVS